MRTAYSGRAAAYEKMGDYERAVLDHNLVVLYYTVEVEVLNDLEAPNRDKLLLEAAQAYRARASALRARGRLAEAQIDVGRAEDLEAEAKKLAGTPAINKGESSSAEGRAGGGGGTGQKLDQASAKPQEPFRAELPGGNGPEAPRPSDTGQIRLINAWTEPVTVVVDSVPYRLQAGEERLISRAAGPFTYEVPGIQQNTTRDLGAGKTF